MKKQLNIYGIRPVLELIESGQEIDTIFLQKDIHTEWSYEIKEKVKKYKLNLKNVPKYKLNRLTQKNHQGVVAITSIINFQNFENLLVSTFEKGDFPIFLLLDRVTDVRNFGSICGSAESLGVHGIIIPKKGSAKINEITTKSSAGAIYNTNICREDSLIKVIHLAKESGLNIIGCTEKGTENIYNMNFKQPTLIILGSEENGITNELLKLCHNTTKIPMLGKTKALNVAVATGIILYEYNRQNL